MAHGPGLAAAREVDLVGVWGRSREKAESLAASLGVTAYDDYDALLADVDAVAFAVPPDVQAEMALAAARAGSTCCSTSRSRSMSTTRAPCGTPPRRQGWPQWSSSPTASSTDRARGSARWRSTGGWRGGWLRWFSSLQEADNPFGASPWRQERGALWDTGPHALSTLGAALDRSSH